MKETGRYNNDPIVEALVDIVATPSVDITEAIWKDMHSQIASEYPTINALVNVESEVSFEPHFGASARQIPAGVAVISGNGKRMLKAQRDRMTFSVLAPYPGWEDFRKEARRLWRIYEDFTKPAEVRQVSVRYINRFDLPRNLPVSDFLQFYPFLPRNLKLANATLSAFFLQTQIEIPDAKASVIFNESTVPAPAPDLASLLLDIGIFRSAELANDDLFLWGLIDQFRVLKNEVFEAVITDKTREMLS
jgi:uncharacterized protein (TIGR04255 family)